MRSTLRKRRSLAPVRLELQTSEESLLVDYLKKRISLKRNQIYTCKAPLDLSYVFALENECSALDKAQLFYPPFQPQSAALSASGKSLLDEVQKKDLLLFYPYQSFDTFLQLIREAAYDENVLSIRITIYRMGNHRAKLMS